MSMAETGPGFSDILRCEAFLCAFGKEDARKGFVEHLVENDSRGLVAPRGFIMDLTKADVFVFLLEKWCDVKFALWQAKPESIYEGLDTENPAAGSVTLETTLNGDDVQFAFFNFSAVGPVPIKCFALDLLASLRTGYVRHVWTSDLCRSQK